MRSVALALTLLLLPATVAAQTDAAEVEDPAAAEARALFERGHALAEARRFSEAVEAFEGSLALVDRPSTVFNLALCFFALERYVEAIGALERFERDAAPTEDPESLADAGRMLTHARAAVARIVVEVEPADAYVAVDGVAVGGTQIRTASVNPGPHVVRITAAHHEPMLLEVDTTPGSEQRRAVALRSTRRPARLEIELVDHPLATILVDGREVGAGHASLELDAGPHSVRVLDADAPPLDRQVALEWNERVRLSLGLPPAPAGSLADEPAFWGVLGGTLGAVAVGVLIGVLATELMPSPDGGSTGEILSPAPPSGGVTLP